MNTVALNDYSLVGKDTALAIERGLAGATWYASPVPKQKMRELLERKDRPAIRDTLLWFALILGSGVCGFLLWGSWWAIIPFFVYGARSLQESFYRDYFENLAWQFPNFAFHLALPEPLPGDNWQSHTGMIHEVLRANYLAGHPDLAGIEYYLCGPPLMVQAALKMLANLNVDRSEIAFDEF